MAAIGWLTFAVSAGLHFWIGDVVVGHMHAEGQNYVLLRENRDLWVPISSFTYFAHHITRALTAGICGCGLLWVLWRWLWYGDLGNP